MLAATLFEPLDSSVSIADFDVPLFDKDKKVAKLDNPKEREFKVARLCMTAKAKDPKDEDPEFVRELLRTFRNPGLCLPQIGRR